jgi:hypothetical protein
MMVMIVTGLAAAGLYGAAAALEQRQAERVPDESAGKLALLGHLARNPLWLLGFAAQFAGFGVHAVALRSGPLDTVQMLVAAELIVAIVLVQIWSGRKLNPTSSAAALTVVAGITAFLFLTTPGGHAHGQGHGMPRLSLVAAVVLGAAAMALVLAGLRAAGHRRAILLALAAGAADACSAVVTMAFTHVIGHGLASVMTSWTTYAVIVAGIGNILLTQTAYQAGRPLVTLPLISAFVPVASVAVGVGLLGEAPRVSLASGVGAGVAVLITSVALAVLARSAPAPSSPVQAAKARPAPAHPGSAQLVPALRVPAQLAHTVPQLENAPQLGGRARGQDLLDVGRRGLAGRVRQDLIVQGVGGYQGVIGRGDAVGRLKRRQPGMTIVSVTPCAMFHRPPREWPIACTMPRPVPAIARPAMCAASSI